MHSDDSDLDFDIDDALGLNEEESSNESIRLIQKHSNHSHNHSHSHSHGHSHHHNIDVGNRSKKQTGFDYETTATDLTRYSCCCRLTPFNTAVFLVFFLGVALLFPGVLLRLSSLQTTPYYISLHTCPTTTNDWRESTVDCVSTGTVQPNSYSITIPSTVMFSDVQYVIYLVWEKQINAGTLKFSLTDSDGKLLTNRTQTLDLNILQSTPLNGTEKMFCVNISECISFGV